MRTVKALARLRGCAGLPEPLLVAYVISTIISCAGSNVHKHIRMRITAQNCIEMGIWGDNLSNAFYCSANASP